MLQECGAGSARWRRRPGWTRVYLKQIRPVVQDGATAMDKLFPDGAGAA